MNWEVIANGKIVESGTIDTIEALPQAKVALEIPFKTTFSKGVEYFLNVSAVLKSDEPLLKADHVLAYEQFLLQEAKIQTPEKATEALSYKITDDIVSVNGKNFDITFNKKTGELTDYKFKGKSLLESGPQVNFWRAPVDNDYGAQTQNKFKIWKDAVTTSTVQTSVKNVSNNEVEITFTRTILNGDAQLIQTFLVDGNGAVKIKNDLKAIKGKHPNLFKFGNKLVLPESYKNITFYGKGPFEAYTDRQHAAKVGLYRQTIEEQYFPYIRPQENGNKKDIRWATITKQDGSGLQFLSEIPFHISALNYSEDDLSSGDKRTQKHAGELDPRKEVFVNIDGFQQGLGSINSWGRLPMEQYRLLYKSYSYSYWMLPVVK